MKTKRWWVVGVGLSLACSSSETPTDGGTDASSDIQAADVIVQEAGNDSGTACNALANGGNVIQQTFVATDAVTGDGGTIVSGTYLVTAAVMYTGADGGSGPTGTTIQESATFDVDAGTFERVQSAINDAGADGNAYRANGIYMTGDAGSMQASQTCPKAPLPFNSYDTNGTTLHIYAPAQGPNRAVMFEYTKQ